MNTLGLLLLYLTSLVVLVSSKDISFLISESTFNEMLKHRAEQPECSGGFYTYASFIEAARSFVGFATTGGTNTRKREIAAFFAQTSEKTAGWNANGDDPYAWGYCYTQEPGHHPPTYCNPSTQWPCAEGKSYYGRGPFLITGNQDYGLVGKAIGVDLLRNPDLVETDPTISFKTALARWMTPQTPTKPSSHDVITRKWKPSKVDKAAGRVPGFGLTTNILTWGNDCHKDDSPSRRIEFYKRYCSLLGVSPGGNIDCYKQKPFS